MQNPHLSDPRESIFVNKNLAQNLQQVTSEYKYMGIKKYEILKALKTKKKIKKKKLAR